MKKTLIIALREFSTTVLRRGFVLTLIAMPLFFVVVPGVLIYLMNSGPGPAKVQQPAALIDNAGIISSEPLDGSHRADSAFPSKESLGGPGFAKDGGLGKDAGFVMDFGFIMYDDLGQALVDLRSGRVSGCYVIEHDYLDERQHNILCR